jgi:excisionase family DNA binding protein
MELKFEVNHQDFVEEIAEKVRQKINEHSSSGLMTVADLANHLHVPKGWVYDRTRVSVEAGGIPCFKIGKYVRFNLPEVLKWLRERN